MARHCHRIKKPITTVELRIILAYVMVYLRLKAIKPYYFAGDFKAGFPLPSPGNLWQPYSHPRHIHSEYS